MHTGIIANPKNIQRGKNTKYHKLMTPFNLNTNSIKKAIIEILVQITQKRHGIPKNAAEKKPSYKSESLQIQTEKQNNVNTNVKKHNAPIII